MSLWVFVVRHRVVTIVDSHHVVLIFLRDTLPENTWKLILIVLGTLGL